MFKQLKESFLHLNKEVQSTIFIRRINKTRTLIITTFANVFIYQVHWTISWMLLSNILYFIASTIWFFIWWRVINNKKETNIKHLFYPAFIILSICFLLMPRLWKTLRGVYTFFFITWIWSGLFYFGTTNYEAVFLNDEVRNFYSSVLNAWYVVLKIVTPLLVALFFYLQPRVDISWYTLLFVTTWFIYLYGLKFIATMPDHIVEKRPLWKIKHYFINWKTTLYSSLFYIFYWLDKWVQILFALLLIMILKTEIALWVYEWALNIFAVFAMIALGVKASKKQQNSIFLWAAWLFALLCILVWTVPSMVTLILFSAWMIIVEPILRSMRLADYYRYQDIINKQWSPHLWVIYAETILTLWRVLIIWSVRLLSLYTSIEQVIARGMTIFAFWYFFMYWNVKTLLPKLQK